MSDTDYSHSKFMQEYNMKNSQDRHFLRHFQIFNWNRVSVIIGRYIYIYIYIYISYEFCCIYGRYVYHILSNSFGSLLYHCIYGYMFCMFCMLLFNFVNHVFLFIYIIIVLLCNLIFIFMYSYCCVCSVYFLCVNVYCSTATRCQPNYS